MASVVSRAREVGSRQGERALAIQVNEGLVQDLGDGNAVDVVHVVLGVPVGISAAPPVIVTSCLRDRYKMGYWLDLLTLCHV